MAPKEYVHLTHQEVIDFLREDETAYAFLQRMQQERLVTGLGFLDQQLRLRPGGLMEVAGPAGSGKSLMLLRLAAHCVVEGVRGLVASASSGGASTSATGGGGGGGGGGVSDEVPARHSVLVVDMDGKMDVESIMQALRSQLRVTFPDMAARAADASALLAQTPPQRPDTLPVTPALAAARQLVSTWEGLEQDCLARVHVVRPHSSLQALAGLLAARGVLERCEDSGAPCRLLLIDNVGAFSHADKAHRAYFYQPQASPAPCPTAAPLAPGQQPPPQPAWGGAPQQGQPYANLPTSPQPAWGGAAAAHQAPTTLAGTNLGRLREPPLNTSKVHTALVAVVHALSVRYRLCVVASKNTSITLIDMQDHAMQAMQDHVSALSRLQDADASGPSRLQGKEYLSHAWTQAVTHKLLLGPPVVVSGSRPGSVATRVPAQLFQGGQGSFLMQLFVDEDGVGTRGW